MVAVLPFRFRRIVVGGEPTQNNVGLDGSVGVITICRYGISQGSRWEYITRTPWVVIDHGYATKTC